MVQGRDGQVLKSYRDVSAGDRVSVTLGEGGFTCTVDEPFSREHRG
jgi:exodeoxyribonuclease VII large subunit